MSAREKLAGAIGKIERADESIRNLDAEITAYVSKPTGHILRGYRETEDAQVIQVGLHGPEVPKRFSILIGEIAHHLRSSLDHLVWQLVLEANGTPNYRSESPIFLDPAEYKASARVKINGVAASAATLIEGWQPYHASGRPHKEDPLWIVHELDRIDKHRLLISTNTSVRYTNYFLIDQFPEGTTRMEYPIRPPLEVDVAHYPVLSVTLKEIVEGKPIVPMLKQLSKYTHRVIDRFSGEFG